MADKTWADLPPELLRAIHADAGDDEECFLDTRDRWARGLTGMSALCPESQGSCLQSAPSNCVIRALGG
jgi:hypothetical protein